MLFPILPETIVPGQEGELLAEKARNARYNGGRKVIPFKYDGTNETALLEQALDEADFGDELWRRGGPVRVDPITISKMVKIKSTGRFGGWWVPSSNYSDPVFRVDITENSGFGIFGNYGAVLEGFGVDRSGHPDGPCMELTPNSAHVTLRDLLLSGGTKGLIHHGPNALFDGLYLWDQSEVMLDMDENGLELTMAHVIMAAQVSNLDAYWRLTISEEASGDLLGGIYGGIVICRSNPAMTVNNGVIFSASESTEIPTFLKLLVVDNVNGGGPAIDLDHVQSVGMEGWANGTNGSVRLNGTVGTQLDLRTRGGTHTYEFVGDPNNGFRSRSEIFTNNPAYKFTGTPPNPEGWDADDWLALATDIGQATNDAAVWSDLGRRRWGGAFRPQGIIRHRENGDAAPAGFGNMVPAAGGSVLLIEHSSIQTNTRIEFRRGTTGATGTPGVLHHDVANNIAGASGKIRSTSEDDTGRVHWEIVGDAD